MKCYLSGQETLQGAKSAENAHKYLYRAWAFISHTKIWTQRLHAFEHQRVFIRSWLTLKND